jgi:hypothetical protein
MSNFVNGSLVRLKKLPEIQGEMLSVGSVVSCVSVTSPEYAPYPSMGWTVPNVELELVPEVFLPGDVVVLKEGKGDLYIVVPNHLQPCTESIVHIMNLISGNTYSEYTSDLEIAKRGPLHA